MLVTRLVEFRFALPSFYPPCMSYLNCILSNNGKASDLSGFHVLLYGKNRKWMISDVITLVSKRVM